MPTPWIPRRLQIAFLAALIAALTANFVADVYQLARGTVKELADVRTLVPAEQGKITLAVVPESRRTVRERFLIFFGKTYYLTTYRIEIENHNAIPPIDGRLVVDCARGRVTGFEEHPLLDPQPAPGGRAGRTFAAGCYADAVDPFAIDLRLPPPSAKLCASLTVVSKNSFVDGSELVVELGHPGGVLRAAPLDAVWTSAE